jgi:hypothetical protein
VPASSKFVRYLKPALACRISSRRCEAVDAILALLSFRGNASRHFSVQARTHPRDCAIDAAP